MLRTCCSSGTLQQIFFPLDYSSPFWGGGAVIATQRAAPPAWLETSEDRAPFMVSKEEDAPASCCYYYIALAFILYVQLQLKIPTNLATTTYTYNTYLPLVLVARAICFNTLASIIVRKDRVYTEIFILKKVHHKYAQIVHKIDTSSRISLQSKRLSILHAK